MSLKKFLANIWKGIKKAFEGLVPELQNAVRIGVALVDKAKVFIDSPAADLITAIIPGNVDDKIRAKIQEELPKILIKLKLVENCLGESDPNKIVECALKTLQDMTKEDRKPFLHSLSILIAQVAADGKLTWSDALFILEWYYNNHKESE
jgi:hypothetical protein